MSGWYGFDLDGTISHYDGWKGLDHIGEPLGADKPRSAFSQAQKMIAAGKDVRIFTARVSEGRSAIPPIQAWCQKHFGKVIPVTNEKDLDCLAIYDDKAVQIEMNTGMPVR